MFVERRVLPDRRCLNLSIDFPDRRCRQRRQTAFQAYLWTAHLSVPGSRTRS